MGDPERPERWYVAATAWPRRAHGGGHADASILRRDGDAWRTVASARPAMAYSLLAPAGDVVVAVDSRGGVRSSADAGEVWDELPVELGPNRAAVLLDA